MIPGIKEKILDTSYAMFRDRGYEQTTLRAIAEACGVTHANVLYHFRSKHDIASSIFQKYLDSLKSEADRLAARQSIRPSVSKATLFWVMHLCYMVEYPDFARVYVDVLRKERAMMYEVILLREDYQNKNPIHEFFDLKVQEGDRAFPWKMRILTDADYHTIEMVETGEISLKEAAFNMVDMISLLFTGKKIPPPALERSVSLMLDLVKTESLEAIHNGCEK